MWRGCWPWIPSLCLEASILETKIVSGTGSTVKIETKKLKLFQEFFIIIKNKKFARVFSPFVAKSHKKFAKRKHFWANSVDVKVFAEMDISIGFFAKNIFSTDHISCFTRFFLFIIFLSCFHLVRNHKICFHMALKLFCVE